MSILRVPSLKTRYNTTNIARANVTVVMVVLWYTEGFGCCQFHFFQKKLPQFRKTDRHSNLACLPVVFTRIPNADDKEVNVLFFLNGIQTK